MISMGPKVPRRSRSCAKSGLPFQPGMEYISLLKEGQGEEYIREDIAFSWWKEQGSEALLKETKSHWRGKVPLKEEAPKTPDQLFERAFELLTEYLEKGSPKAFLIALFLARKKKLILREEFPDEAGVTMLYEVAETEEMISVRAYELHGEEMAKFQQELNCEIGALS